MAKKNKDCCISSKVTADEKELLEKVDVIITTSRSEWIRSVVVKAAKAEIKKADRTPMAKIVNEG